MGQDFNKGYLLILIDGPLFHSFQCHGFEFHSLNVDEQDKR
ncbi:hypothetical protein HMPREF9373_1558 [Psychrobacter sp. 1501(2011)]|nr:hypothetical protein HMPREF9373_1558 [Psychrobacter sp. 1501(2011)]